MRVCLLLADDADEMVNLLDHAAHLSRIRQLGDPADLVELQPDQRRALRVMAADRASDLLDLDLLCGHDLKTPKALIGRRFGIAADAARLQRGDLDVATRSDRARRVLLLQRVE